MSYMKEGSLRDGPSPPMHLFDHSHSPLELFGFRGHHHHHHTMMLEGGCSETLGMSYMHLPMVFDPTSSSGSSIAFGGGNSPPQDAQSSVRFKVDAAAAAADGWAYSSKSVLSFERPRSDERSHHLQLDQEDECASWIDAMEHDHQLINHLNYSKSADIHDQDCGGSGSTDNSSQKRQSTGAGDILQVSKKHCGNSKKTNKVKSPSSNSKDPQSIAAKNRRERISERLKILQELVPNGNKVDMVTMLEKAISYVKFLQLQVKVLATDEFWPAQGGKAPEIGQVKEAIDAILSTQRDKL